MVYITPALLLDSVLSVVDDRRQAVDHSVLAQRCFSGTHCIIHLT